MRKTDKKIDNQLRLALTDVCEIALKEIEGFEWLTHIANYSSFPNSLKIVCIFDTRESLNGFTAKSSEHSLTSLIQTKLDEIGIKIKNITDHIAYDTEESCDKENDGNWAIRLA